VSIPWTAIGKGIKKFWDQAKKQGIAWAITVCVMMLVGTWMLHRQQDVYERTVAGLRQDLQETRDKV
jgi:hypothetical protein